MGAFRSNGHAVALIAGALDRSRSNEKMVLNYGFHDAKPFGSDVLTFNERAFIADGDLTALLAELRRVCEGDETSTLLMLHDLLRQRLE